MPVHSTAGPARRSSSRASASACSGGAIGSVRPAPMNTPRPPPRSTGVRRAAAAPSAPAGRAAAKHLRPQQQHRGGDVGAVREPDGDHAARGRTRRRRRRRRRSRPARWPARSDPRRRTRPRRAGGTTGAAPRSSTRPRGDSRAAPGRQHPAQRQQVVLVAAGAVQQQQGRAPSPPLPGWPGSNRWTSAISRASPVIDRRMRAAERRQRASITSRWGSSHGGSRSRRPSSSSGSSIGEAGRSVAISNSTPPGSRK